MMGNKQEPNGFTDGDGGLREIFLFPNGQQDSPPRKFSLGVNEPWDVMLKRISTAQPGSQHMMELYTLEGKRIEGPLELSDGTAYVAVAPPQRFEPAGYRDYLMKASRSREKRKSEINSSSKPVKIVSKEKLTGDNEETAHNIIQNPILIPHNVIDSKDRNAIKDKVPLDTDRNVKATKRIIKTNQNKLSNRNSLMTKNFTNGNDVPESKKIRSSYKVDSIKKKFEMSGSKNKIAKKNISPLSRSKIANTKNNSTVTETKITPMKNSSTVTELKTASTKNNSTLTEITIAPTIENPTVTEDSENKLNTVGHVSTIITKGPSNLHKEESQSNRDIPRSYSDRNLIALSTAIPYEVDNYDTNLRSTKSIDDNNSFMPAIDDSSRSKNATGQNKLYKTVTDSNITTDVRDQFTQPKTVSISDHIDVAENNLKVNVKQGKSVNLKFDIRFTYDYNTVEKNHNNCICTTKSESPSQDIDVASDKGQQEAPALAGVELSFEQLHQISSHARAAVYEYRSGSTSKNTEPFILVNVHNNETGLILLPLRKQNKICDRYSSELEIGQYSKSAVQESQMLPREKNNIVKSDDVNFVSDVSELSNPSKDPRNATEESDYIKFVSKLPENYNTSNSAVQLNEATIKPVSGRDHSNWEPTTGYNAKQSDELKMSPGHPSHYKSNQSSQRSRNNSAQTNQFKSVPHLPNEGNSIQSTPRTRDQNEQTDNIKIKPQLSDQDRPSTRDNNEQTDETIIEPELSDYENLRSRTRTVNSIIQSNDINIATEIPEKNNGLINEHMLKDQSKRVSILEAKTTCKCCKTCKLQNKSTRCSCGMIQLLTSPLSDDEQHITSVSTFRDAFTQTAWNGTVLEARPREDGSYQLHMPTLATLKRYNAL